MLKNASANQPFSFSSKMNTFIFRKNDIYLFHFKQNDNTTIYCHQTNVEFG